MAADGFSDGVEVSAAEAVDLAANGAAWLLDVREGYEWDAGHAAAAYHIPLQGLRLRQGELPDDRRIIVICHSGGRSRRATDALLSAGYPAANVRGGMESWRDAGGDVITSDGAAGSVV